MREYQLFLRLLAERVYDVKPRLLDVMDFKEWLLKCADKVGESATVQEFFDKL
jgi:hypothetical protein